MKTIKLTPGQFEKLLHRIEEEFPTFLKRIGWNPAWETICGAISTQIVTFLRQDLGVDAKFMQGQYHGRGTEFSGGRTGTYHCWVQLKVLLSTSYKRESFNVIIDGAYAQFFPGYLPRFIRDRMRLTVFINDKTAEKWYRGNEDSCQNDVPLNSKVNL